MAKKNEELKFQRDELVERTDMPELALLRAALQKAFLDLRSPAHMDQSLEWFRSEGHEHPFAFEVICDRLNLHPEPLRIAAEGLYGKKPPTKLWGRPRE